MQTIGMQTIGLQPIGWQPINSQTIGLIQRFADFDGTIPDLICSTGGEI